MSDLLESTKEKVRRAIELIAQGQTVTEACRLADICGTTLYRGVSGDSELARAYTRARELQTLIEVDEAKDIADDPNVDPQSARNRIDIRKWRASKFHPSIFGDKLDLSITQSISMTEVLSEARGRLRLMSDPAQVIDAEVIDNKGSIASKPSDHKSDDPNQAPDSPVDIFS